MRKVLASGPHNRGCLSAVMMDIVNAMLAEKGAG
jgi:hypothetical protein